MTSTATEWLPASVVADIEALLDDDAPHAVVLGRVGCGRSRAARALARRMCGVEARTASEGTSALARSSLEVVVLEGTDLEGDEGLQRARTLARSGARLVLVPHSGTAEGVASLPVDLRSSSSVLRLRLWNEHDVTEYLAHTREGEPDPDLVRSLVEVTGGHPAHIRHFASLHEGVDEADDLLAPGLWEGGLDRQMTTLGRAARSLVEELAVGFRVLGEPGAPSLGDADRDHLLEELDQHALLGTDGELLPLARTTVRTGMPVHRLQRMRLGFLDGVDDPTPHTDVIADMVDDGVRAEKLADVTRDLGDRDLVDSPAIALQWYDRSERAGTAPCDLAARRAEAFVRVGDVAAAAHMADLILRSGPSLDLDRVVSAALIAHVERGLVSQARELSLWARTALGRTTDVDLTTVCWASGDANASVAAVEEFSDATAAPTLGKGASTTALHGIRQSLTNHTAEAVADLAKAAHLVPPDRSALSPFPISLLAGWAALHAGDPVTADAVARRAEPSAAPHVVQRHLLLGWAALWQDHLEESRRCAGRAAAALDDSQLRNRLILAGLRSGIARRTTDNGEVVRAWHEARECLGRVEPDLFMLLALGELNLAAVRTRESDLLTTDIEAAQRLLVALGSPPLWSAPLHWSCVQAAILADRPSDIAPHATALVHAAATHPFAARLATAGKVWMHVLARDFAPVDVGSAATGLAEVGQAWDGARLASHAAARCDDRRDSASLRELARSLRGTERAPAPEPLPDHAPGAIPLTERELEVVRLVLEGKTYREVGAALFLSARTVEHHMARIRRRSGAESRSELLERLLLTVQPPQH